MDDIQWYMHKLLALDGKSYDKLQNSNMIAFLRALSELELAWVQHLTNSEIISRAREVSETSANHDEEKARLC